jgi:hypothetical protein
MTQEALEKPQEKPLNRQQAVFARELGVALAAGGRDAEITAAYVRAGYAEDRGNARRLAADPRVKELADKACQESLRLAGFHVGYLQGLALKLLHTSPSVVYRAIDECLDDEGMLRSDLTEPQKAALDAATWPLSKLKIGDISIELADKKSLIEMLAKQLGVGKDDPANVNVGVQVPVRFIVEGAPSAA